MSNNPEVESTPTHPLINWRKPFITGSFDLACSLATIGFPWKPRRNVNAHDTSQEKVNFKFPGTVHIAMASGPPTQYNTRHFYKQIATGALESECSEHPFCYAGQALMNRRALLKFTRDKKRLYCVRKDKGGITAIVNDPAKAASNTLHVFFGTMPRAKEYPDFLPTRATPEPVKADWSTPFETDNLPLACALQTLGIPLKYESPPLFQFPSVAWIPQSTGKVIGYKTHEIFEWFRESKLQRVCPEHPFNYAMMSLINRADMLERLKSTDPLWHFRREANGLTAMINHGDDAALDMVTRFFKRTGRHYGKGMKNPLI